MKMAMLLGLLAVQVQFIFGVFECVEGPRHQGRDHLQLDGLLLNYVRTGGSTTKKF